MRGLLFQLLVLCVLVALALMYYKGGPKTRTAAIVIFWIFLGIAALLVVGFLLLIATCSGAFGR